MSHLWTLALDVLDSLGGEVSFDVQHLVEVE